MHPLRFVLDTNIVMDMLHFGDPRTHPLFNAISEGRIRCFSDPDCLGELERVTGYPEFGLAADGRARLMARYLQFVDITPLDPEFRYSLPRCRDADDQKFLMLAARCSADALVTRDKLLLRLARHRHNPPPFAIVTSDAASLLLSTTEDPAPLV